MYGLLRIIIWIPILAFVSQQRKNLGKNKYIILVLMIIFVAMPVSSLFPIENLFVTFSTPEKSYNYVNFEKAKITISGDNTDLVIGHENTYLIIPKTDKGWKIGRGIDTKTVSANYNDGIIVSLFKHKKSGEYYVEVYNLDGKTCTIEDSGDSEFYNVKNEELCRYYAYVHNLDDSYELFVNGKEVNLAIDE